MWREIIEHNTPAVLASIRNFEASMKNLEQLIESGDFDGFEREFGKGKALRDSWMKYKNY